jgi:serine/threonine-protein kinase
MRVSNAPLPPPTPPPPNAASYQTLASATALPPPAAPPVAVSVAPAPPEKKAKAPGDMDWDEEDGATHVFAGAQNEPATSGPRPAAGVTGSAAALLAGSGGQAAKPALGVHTPLTMPPPSAAPPTEPSPARPPRVEEATVVRARPTQATASGGKAGVIFGVISLVVVLGLAVFLLMPRKGQLKIDVKSATGGPIAKAEIYIDGQKKCDTTPCVVADLEPGSKNIKIIAPDYALIEQVESIEAGQEKVVLIPLIAGAVTQPTAAPVGPQVTGLKIGGSQQGVKVFVDGAEKGTLPLDLKDIAPGTHKIRLEGGDRYEKLEQSVDIVAGQVKDLGALKLKVLKGQVTLDLITQGANVSLIKEDGGKKTEKKLPAAVWKSPPVKIDIDASEKWKLVATKKGFDELTQEISFEDGQAEKTIRIELAEAGKAPPAVAVGSINNPSGNDKTPPTSPGTGGDKPPPTAGTGTAPGGDKPPPAGTGGGNGTLNINSIPVSKVVLDGRPLGSTPKVGVSVSAGSHTVTFIHPELGKKSVTVQVKAGETKTAAVKFK